MRASSLYPLSLLLVLALSGCSLFGDGATGHLVPILKVEVVEQAPLQMQFRLTSQWPDTCGRVDRIVTDRDGTHYVVRMFGRGDGSQICGLAITTLTDTWTAKVPHPGSYTFSFMQREGAAIDTTFTIE